ncbi:TetR/AcrR family transcriptional regulator [Mesorhizobium sp. BAC0120]|uniref:TetR/AcrR family transcriptional regulator n=1 Tax=Mesorhizobium sp. BAC0120 TaxID=3090670 RepID=UPI00298C7667|nr:TetR/AcrR family transcriptional regulator [Mesorhizobium sp. BAC0120]MDW6022406.1 TetR/AcrR family transcriptional regulator [Mesorhizobium sp. BAC0120]
MSGSVIKKLPKAARREQLLETAQAIMSEEGTDALTLGYVAERAGVSKPIAYEHFGTRAGLLIALCSDYDQRQMQAQRKAIEAGGETLQDVAAIFASSYVSCVLDMGPAMGAAFAALSATEETADFRQSLRRGYVVRYREGFGRVVKLPRNDEAIFLGFLGAAEALAQDAAARRISREEAVDALSRIFRATLERYPSRGKAS